jgi:hypothetical protein
MHRVERGEKEFHNDSGKALDGGRHRGKVTT